MEFTLNTRTQLVLLNVKLRKKRKIDYIVNNVTKLLDGSDLDDLVSTVKDIATLIENQIYNRNKKLDDKIDKKLVFNLIVKKLFSNIDDDGLNTMNDMLEFLIKHNHIKRVPYSAVFYFKLKTKLNSFFSLTNKGINNSYAITTYKTNTMYSFQKNLYFSLLELTKIKTIAIILLILLI